MVFKTIHVIDTCWAPAMQQLCVGPCLLFGFCRPWSLPGPCLYLHQPTPHSWLQRPLQVLPKPPFLPSLWFPSLTLYPWNSLADLARQPHLDTEEVSCHLVTFCSLQKEPPQSGFQPHPHSPVGPLWAQGALPASCTEPHPSWAPASSALSFPNNLQKPGSGNLPSEMLTTSAS